MTTAKFTLPQSNYSKLPHTFIEHLPDFSEAELRVVLYTLRHTWGYGEYERKKRITLDEYVNGRKRADGSRIDRGCGVKEAAAARGLARAVENGFLVMEEDASDLGRVKRYYGIAIADVIQGDQIDHPGFSKEYPGDPNDHPTRSKRSPDQGKNLLKETEEKEQTIDARGFKMVVKPVIVDDAFPLGEIRRKALLMRQTPQQKAELQTVADPVADETRLAGARTVLNGNDPMAYMGVWGKVEAHDYWLTFQRAYPQAERLSARNAVDIWQDIEQMTSMDVMPAEIEQVIAWRITPKRKQPYKFEYLLSDIKALRERDKIDDPDLELAICKVFKVQAGDFTKRLTRFFEGKEGDLPAWNLYRLKDKPMSARELAAFKRWYDDDERYDNQETPPTTAANLRDKIDLFRASPNHAARVERAQSLLDLWRGVQSQPVEVVTVVPDADFAAQIDMDVENFATMFSGGRR